MKYYALLLVLALSIYAGSCVKDTSPSLVYSIDTVTNAYVPNNDTAVLPIHVKFLTGNTNEQVWVTIEGLPSHVTLRQDTITGTPSFVANFVLFANNATLGYYPITLVTYSKSTGIRRYNMTLGIVTSDCGSFMAGTYTGSNACASANFTYSSTATAQTSDSITIVNFGGYGTNTTTGIRLNCNTDSVTIRSQNIGNGVTVSGKGYFVSNKMVINYIALNTPGGFNDTCTATLTR